jgi:predicted RNase H-related nuclease YkuK (DUF458 family)
MLADVMDQRKLLPWLTVAVLGALLLSRAKIEVHLDLRTNKDADKDSEKKDVSEASGVLVAAGCSSRVTGLEC